MRCIWYKDDQILSPKIISREKDLAIKNNKNNDRFKIKNDIIKDRYSKKVRAVKFEKK